MGSMVHSVRVTTWAILFLLSVAAVGFAAVPDADHALDETALTPARPAPGRAGSGILELTGCDRPGDACTWQRTYGGRRVDKAYAVAALADGGFAIAGHTRARGGSRDDAWVIRLDHRGDRRWERVFGGPDTEQLYGVAATPDGGVVVTGHTRSRGAGGSDIWLTRFDRDGTPVWEGLFGGPGNDRARALATTADGDLVVVGFVTLAARDGRQAWVARLAPDGSLRWQRSFASPSHHAEAFAVAVTPDGEILVTGHKQLPGAAGYDLWLARLDGAGEVQLDRTYGLRRLDAGTAVVPTADGGAFVAGAVGGPSLSRTDIWLVRVDRAGELVWQRVLGGDRPDLAWAAVAAVDGGVIALASTQSRGHGSADAWVLHLAGDGRLVGERVLGGRLWDRPSALATTRDGGLIVVGHTTTWGAGFEDAWVLRLGQEAPK